MPPPPPIRCALFDIDGTLVSMRGAGPRAMDRAFLSRTGVPDAFRDLPMAGRSDRAIVDSAIERLLARGCAVPCDEAFHREFIARYLVELEAEAAPEGPSVCPGVIATLDVLERRGVALGLGTGNFEGAARIKLERFGLWSRFSFGGFGDATPRRVDVIRNGAREALRRCSAAALEIVVIGDTPADIEAGRAIGARVLAVATGPVPLSELAGLRPDAAFPTLFEALSAGFWTG
ncbi:MAG: HAD family hydrolase [Deltaproteobacteria bacterium]|nr:HAD family hydrolase [Deltaproteobacteria bacterium]